MSSPPLGDDEAPVVVDADVSGVETGVKRPRKVKKFRDARPHANPLADSGLPIPTTPDDMDWSNVFKGWKSDAQVSIVDVGCGYGGLLENLSPLFPNDFILGMEIRPIVVTYVEQRIERLQQEQQQQPQPSELTSHPYTNIGVMPVNVMKDLAHFFRKGQLQKMFFLYPDPNWKRKARRRRIINTALLAEYAYVLAVGGLLYTVTDIRQLYDWQVRHLDAHPLFERVSDEEMQSDPCVPLAKSCTDEAEKAKRQGRDHWICVYRRVSASGVQ